MTDTPQRVIIRHGPTSHHISLTSLPRETGTRGSGVVRFVEAHESEQSTLSFATGRISKPHKVHIPTQVMSNGYAEQMRAGICKMFRVMDKAEAERVESARLLMEAKIHAARREFQVVLEGAWLGADPLRLRDVDPELLAQEADDE